VVELRLAGGLRVEVDEEFEGLVRLQERGRVVAGQREVRVAGQFNAGRALDAALVLEFDALGQHLLDAHLAEVNLQAVVRVEELRLLDRQSRLGASAFQLEGEFVTRGLALAVDHCGLEEALVDLHVLGVEGEFDVGELVRVDDEVGGLGGEDGVLVLVVDLDVDLALDLVRVDDFDALLHAVRLLGHDQRAEVELVFVLELGGLVHDLLVLLEHLQVLERRLLLEDHLVVRGDDARDAGLGHDFVLAAVLSECRVGAADLQLQVLDRDDRLGALVVDGDGGRLVGLHRPAAGRDFPLARLEVGVAPRLAVGRGALAFLVVLLGRCFRLGVHLGFDLDCVAFEHRGETRGELLGQLVGRLADVVEEFEVAVVPQFNGPALARAELHRAEVN